MIRRLAFFNYPPFLIKFNLSYWVSSYSLDDKKIPAKALYSIIALAGKCIRWVKRLANDGLCPKGNVVSVTLEGLAIGHAE